MDRSPDNSTVRSGPPDPNPSDEPAAVVLNRTGHVLPFSPTYTPGWDLPGARPRPTRHPKPPLHAKLREELGLNAVLRGFLVVDWVPPHGPRDGLPKDGQLRMGPSATTFGGVDQGESDAGLGAEGLPEHLAELGGMRGHAGVPTGEVQEFRAETLGQKGGGTVRQLAA